jgi:hypothetical protein
MNTRGILCATAAIMCLWAARPSAVLHSGVYVSEDSALVEVFVPAQVPETTISPVRAGGCVGCNFIEETFDEMFPYLLEIEPNCTNEPEECISYMQECWEEGEWVPCIWGGSQPEIWWSNLECDELVPCPSVLCELAATAASSASSEEDIAAIDAGATKDTRPAVTSCATLVERALNDPSQLRAVIDRNPHALRYDPKNGRLDILGCDGSRPTASYRLSEEVRAQLGAGA